MEDLKKPIILSFPISLVGTPGKDKIYLSSPEVDNIRLQRGHADTGQNIQYTAAQLTLTHPRCVCECAEQQTQAHTAAPKHTYRHWHEINGNIYSSCRCDIYTSGKILYNVIKMVVKLLRNILRALSVWLDVSSKCHLIHLIYIWSQFSHKSWFRL